MPDNRPKQLRTRAIEHDAFFLSPHPGLRCNGGTFSFAEILMDRRLFIAYGLSSCLLAALAACRSHPLPSPSPIVSGRQLPAAWRAMLADAARSPSSHNIQPWQLHLDTPTHGQLCPSPSRRQVATDPAGRETWISLGAFTFALEVAALAQGYRLESGWAASTPERLQITLHPCQAADQWLTCLRQRRTLRRNLAPAKVDEKLWATADEQQTTAFYLPHDTTEAARIAQATLEASLTQAGDEAVWQELADWIRWRDEDARRNPTGITPASMELPRLARRWVAAFYGREDVLAPAFRQRSLDLTRSQVREGAGWLVIAAPDDSPQSHYAAGRHLMRCWLAATAQGLALHPMSQALEVESIRHSLGKDLATAHLQMLLRVGRPPSYPAPVCPRLAPEDFVTPSFA